MARDAIARLYDVDDKKVEYQRPRKQGKYDHGTITFQARKGKLIELDKLHESVWGTRLCNGTRSGLMSLEVTAVGTVVVDESETVLRVKGSTERFVLIEDAPRNATGAAPSPLQRMREAAGRGKTLRVTGRVDGWRGRWPEVLRKLPAKPRRIVVTGFQIDQN